MSFSDAIGQVDQIVQWEQQLANPSALTQSSGTAATGTTSNTGSSDASNSSSFSDALAQAQSQDPSTDSSSGTDSSSLLSGGDSQLLSALQSASTGSTASSGSSTGSTDSSALVSALESALSSGSGATAASASTIGSTNSSGELTAILQALGNSSAATSTTAATSAASGTFGSSATSADDPRIASMTQEANSLVGKPYVWGGGHNNFGPQSGYDCSGFVSAVLHAGGYLTSPQDTETLPTAAGMASGPGQYVTVYDRTTPGQEGHVIMEINGQFYESGGQSGSWGGGGGVEKIATPSASYLATFNTILHPEGL